MGHLWHRVIVGRTDNHLLLDFHLHLHGLRQSQRVL